MLQKFILSVTSNKYIAWRILHNIVVTPRRLYQWKKRKKEDCPWCVGVSGTLEHICSYNVRTPPAYGTNSQTLQYLLGTHKISGTTVIYGYSRSDSTAHQLANVLLTLAKSKICQTYMAAMDTDGQPSTTTDCY
jgi:hypothetical protein